MPIDLRVGAQFKTESARLVRQAAQRELDRKDAELKVQAKLVESSVRAAIAETKRLLAKESAEINVKTTIDRNIDGGLIHLIRRLNEVGRATAFTARGLATFAGPLVGIALIDIAKGAVTASQSIALLPAVVSSAAAAFGTLKLATMGFSDAIKDIGDAEKFAADLQGLAPSAQQAALSIQNLLPAFKDLQQATQNAFFTGFGEELHRLTNEYLPGIKAMTTSIAGSFNEMIRGIGDQLMTPGTQTALQQSLDNIATAFRELAPAARSFVQAFVDLTASGSNFLPQLAASAADAAQAFADFIREARESGKLQEFIQNGIDAVGVLGSAIWELGGILYRVFGSEGQQNVNEFKDTLQGVNEVIGLLTLDSQTWGDTVNDELSGMTGAAAVFRDAIMDIPEAFAWLVDKIITGINAVKHAMDNFASNSANFLNFLNPFGDTVDPFVPLPDIPHLAPGAGGDWGGYAPPVGGRTPGTYRTRDGQERRIPNAGGPNPLGPNPFGSYPGPFNVPPPPPPAAGGGGGGGGGGTGTKPAAFQVDPNAAQQAINFAAAQQGKPYGPSAGPTYYDCSGFMSDIFAVMTGKPYQGSERYFTTEANFPSLGFEPGYKAGDFNIGVNSAAAGFGSNAHMAGTLPNGVNVEAGGGGGLKYGGAAKGAKSFQQMYHLPVNNAFNSAYGGLGGAGAGDGLASNSLGSAPPSGSGIPVFVTNMGSGGLGGGGGGAGGSGGGLGGGGDPLSSFFGGMAGAGGPLGPLGTLGGNIMGQLTGSGGGGGGGGGLTGGGLLGMLMNGGMGGGASPSAMGPAGIGGGMGPGPTGRGAGAGLAPGGQGMFDPTGTGSTPPEVQGKAPGEGGWQPQGGGFKGLGGLPMAAIKGAASASPIPGVGAGMDMAMELINKAAAFGGQATAIGAQGLMETFLPHGSTLGDPSQNWVGKIASGFAGARPASAGTAGKLEVPSKQQEKPDGGKVDPNTKQHGQGKGQPPGPLIGTMNYTGPADNGTKVAADIGRQTNAYGAGMGW